MEQRQSQKKNKNIILCFVLFFEFFKTSGQFRFSLKYKQSIGILKGVDNFVFMPNNIWGSSQLTSKEIPPFIKPKKKKKILKKSHWEGKMSLNRAIFPVS